MVNRINLILRAKNITSRQFADEIGIQPSGMSHILGGRNNPSLDFALKVLRRYPEINANWLLLGQGEMYNSEAASPTPSAPIAQPTLGLDTLPMQPTLDLEPPTVGASPIPSMPTMQSSPTPEPADTTDATTATMPEPAPSAEARPTFSFPSPIASTTKPVSPAVEQKAEPIVNNAGQEAAPVEPTADRLPQPAPLRTGTGDNARPAAASRILLLNDDGTYTEFLPAPQRL